VDCAALADVGEGGFYDGVHDAPALCQCGSWEGSGVIYQM